MAETISTGEKVAIKRWSKLHLTQDLLTMFQREVDCIKYAGGVRVPSVLCLVFLVIHTPTHGCPDADASLSGFVCVCVIVVRSSERGSLLRCLHAPRLHCDGTHHTI